jgi:hypothetical protein
VTGWVYNAGINLVAGVMRLAGITARKAHETCYPMDACLMAPASHIAPHARAAVGAVALLEARSDLRQELIVLNRSNTLRALQPLVEPTSRYLERTAELTDLPHRLVPGDERKPHRRSFAK